MSTGIQGLIPQHIIPRIPILRLTRETPPELMSNLFSLETNETGQVC